MVQFNLTASTNLHSVAAVPQPCGQAGERRHHPAERRRQRHAGCPTTTNSGVEYNGKKGVYIGIQTVPSASLLAVIDGVKAVLPSIQQQLPAGLSGDVIYDSTVFVNSSINEVERSLAETVLIVTLVVFAFLGSPRSVVIPVVTIPLSLIGTFAAMLVLGFSINLLSCWPWCWRSGWWWMMPSSWWKASIAILKKACGPAMRRSGRRATWRIRLSR